MILLHVCPVAWEKICGPCVSVPGLTAALNQLDGVEAALVVSDPKAGKAPELGFPVFDCEAVLRGSGRLELPAPFDRPDLAVFHSTYIPLHAAIARRFRRAAVPYLICPRGGMSRFAQAMKPWKKRLGNLVFFNRIVAHAKALHCLSEGEAEASRRWGRPIFIVGNGVHLPSPPWLASPGRSAKLRLMFLGRLDVGIKGLDMLLDACGLLRQELLAASAVVELFGPDVRGGAKVLHRQAARLGLQQVVRGHGPRLGEAKAAAFRQADVFLHTSRTEAHSLAVLEALAAGLPCLLTSRTNMAEEVASAGAGWSVEPSPEGIAAGIEKLLHASATELQAAGIKAREMAANRYTWHQVANETLDAYRPFAA